jgi:hypothetical protein
MPRPSIVARSSTSDSSLFSLLDQLLATPSMARLDRHVLGNPQDAHANSL